MTFVNIREQLQRRLFLRPQGMTKKKRDCIDQHALGQWQSASHLFTMQRKFLALWCCNVSKLSHFVLPF